MSKRRRTWWPSCGCCRYANAQTIAGIPPIVQSVSVVFDPINLAGVAIIAKYFVGWLLGVPVVVLVVLYLIFH
jgi:hypothetical protein